MNLHDLLLADRTPTVVGFDDGPPDGDRVPLAGVVCLGRQMEGMVWTSVTRDGTDATPRVLEALDGKFRPQLHALLLDGITFGGLNLVDLRALHADLGIPCVAVLRRPPDTEAFRGALRAAGLEARWPLVQAAGPVHEVRGHCFQAHGAAPETVARLLDRTTANGRVPEALRLAHLIAGAVTTGTSGRRA